MNELLQTTLWQTSWIGPVCSYIFLRNLETEDVRAVTLAASQPPEELSHAEIITLAGLFRFEPAAVQPEEAIGRMAEFLRTRGAATLHSYPLNVRGYANGWIVIGLADAQPITTELRRFMTTLSDQAGISIENQRLFARTEEMLQETSLLYHASRILADAQSPAEILAAFAEYAVSRPIHYAALYALLSETASTSYAAVEVLATWGDNVAAAPSGTRYRADQLAFWDAAIGSVIVHIDDVARADNISSLAQEELVSLGVSSATVIPLRVADRPVGALVIGYKQTGVMAEQQARMFEALSDQAAITLENTRLYQQAQRRARQLSTSAEISRAVTSILYLDELLPQVVNQIRDSFEYDHVQIFLLSEDNTDANLVASTGEAGRKLLEQHHSLPVGSQSVIGQVTATGQPQIALDTADARVIHRPNPLLPFTRSEMALPLVARGQIVGALDVQSNQPRAFTDQDAQTVGVAGRHGSDGD